MNIFFISFREGNCEDNWQRTKHFHPNAIRLHGIKGIDTVHLTCNSLSHTDFFWTIDGDNCLTKPLEWNNEVKSDLILFHALDPMYNDLTLLGGVKLWRKNSIINSDMSKGDFCLNATKNKEVINTYFSITMYNSTPFDCWKTSFRHCVKLQSMFMRDRPNATKIDFYLQRWKNCNVLTDTLNSNWGYAGYEDACNWVKQHDNSDFLFNVNNYDYLEMYFEEKYGRV